ncbi:MAG: flotillin-like FloA family protein [Pirellulaceae bacterium]|nr:flotillin-like FloA family protein [Pirellulaceae bacterium]
MNDRHVVFIFIAGTMFVVFALILFAVIVLLVRPWLRAALNAAPVPLIPIVAMRLRGNPPTLLIDAYIALKHAGMSTTIGDVENVYIDNRNRVSTSDDLVELVKQRDDVD